MTDPTTILTFAFAAAHVPVAYVVTKIALGQFQASSPDGRDLGTFPARVEAARRCQRHLLGMEG